MEVVRTFETLVNFNVTTRRYILEDSKLHTRCCENLKSHMDIVFTHLSRFDQYFFPTELTVIYHWNQNLSSL
jgi:hypothetical protein